MLAIPSNATIFTPPTATVEFGRFFDEGVEYIYFDTSRCGPPEPMVNAMIALSMLDSANKRVVMINHKSPVGLLEKVKDSYDVVEYRLPDGTVQVVFSLL